MQTTISIFLLTILLTASGIAQAHLKSDPGFECFRMVDDKVQEIPNTLSRSPSTEIISVEAAPSWIPDLAMGDSLNLQIQFRVAVCRPFLVFAHPVYENDHRLRISTSPSPAYEPGEYEGKHSSFIKIDLSDKQSNLETASIRAVRVWIEEYGSGTKLAEVEFPLSATWIATPVLLKPSERCTNEMKWPPEASPSQQCKNASGFAFTAGFKFVDKVDLNADGICELLVEVESCRKLNNNICYKIYEEQNGTYREIWQYYNRLLFFDVDSGYMKLGSTETGLYQHVHRVGTFDPVQRRYVTERVLEPCSD